MRYETVDKILFPAITFCNMNLARCSVVGASEAILTILAGLGNKDKDMRYMLDQIFQVCIYKTFLKVNYLSHYIGGVVKLPD